MAGQGHALYEEKADIDQSVVDDFLERVPSLVDGYTPQNVFNCDETGLYYRALPDKTLTGQADNPDVDIDHKLPTEDTDHWEDALLTLYLPCDSDNDSDEDTPTTSQTMTQDKPKLTRVKIREMLEDLMHYAHTEDTSFLPIVTELTHCNNIAIATKLLDSKQCSMTDFFV